MTVVSGSDDQLTGGYLLVDASGRPLEFHCTVPVRASRAQEILYGATLEPFLYGEQIGATLVQKPKIRPLSICTDCLPMMSVRNTINMPVLFIGEANSAGRFSEKLDAFALDAQQVAVDPSRSQDRATIEAALSKIQIQFDLAEPFDRIRGAFEEAQRKQAA